MKIALVITQLRNGGGSYQLLHLARHLLHLGHEVTVYSYYKPFHIDPSLLVAIPHVCLNYDPPLQKREWQPVGLVKHIWGILILSWRLSQVLGQGTFDVVNPHEWPAYWPAVWAKKKNRSRLVWMCNDVWHITGQEEFPEKRILFRWNSRNGMGRIDRVMAKHLDKIVVLDHRILNIVTGYYPTSARVVRSGLDIEKFLQPPDKKMARKVLSMPPKKKVILALSIFHPHRRFEDVVDAFSRLNATSAQLYLVGSDAYDPAYAAKIRQKISQLELEDKVVIDNRFLSREKLIQYLAASDIFVFANEKQTWGLAVIEAMAMGLACIVSDQAGVHEIIRNGKTGFIFEKRNSDELASYLRTLLVSPSVRDSIGEKARAHALKNYSWKKYAIAMEAVFEEVLNNL